MYFFWKTFVLTSLLKKSSTRDIRRCSIIGSSRNKLTFVKRSFENPGLEFTFWRSLTYTDFFLRPSADPCRPLGPSPWFLFIGGPRLESKKNSVLTQRSFPFCITTTESSRGNIRHNFGNKCYILNLIRFKRVTWRGLDLQGGQD